MRERGILPFRLDASRPAVETGAPVVPVAIDGTRRMFPDGARLLQRGPSAIAIA